MGRNQPSYIGAIIIDLLRTMDIPVRMQPATNIGGNTTVIPWVTFIFENRQELHNEQRDDIHRPNSFRKPNGE